jgi:hypothetical protein
MKRPVALVDVVRWAVVTLGVILYCLIALFMALGSRDDENAWNSIWSVSQTIFEYILLGSGLPPLMIAVYFLGICKTGKAWLVGAILLPLFVVAHFVISVYMAHGPTSVHIPLILGELAAAIAAIWFWERNSRRHVTVSA